MDIGKKMPIAKIICIILITGIACFLLGTLGVFYQKQSNQQGPKDEIAGNLSSKVISSITAYGKVTNIEGRNITLSNLGDSLPISIVDSARVYSFVVATSSGSKNSKKPITAPSTQKSVGFESIKIGESVNVVLGLSANKQMQGLSVVILPQSDQSK